MAIELKNKKGEVFYQATGVIKSFNEKTGFGFIWTKEEPEEDIFAHFSKIVSGQKVLEVGDEVDFLYKRTDKGLRAYQIKKL